MNAIVAPERTDLVPAHGSAVAALQSRMQTILDVMANVLEDGKDYGKIPGTDKPTLFKPGAEKLMLTFQLAASEPVIEDLSTEDEVRYRVKVPIVAPDGRTLAVGIGEASTNEEKYRWRKPVCDEEFNETLGHLRREKWFKGSGGGPYKGKQIRTVPSDLANTVLKMGHKRGFIHGTLLATGASSVFNQDLEDFTKELRESLLDEDHEAKAKPSVTPPQRKSSTKAKPAGESQTVVGILEKSDKGEKFWSLRLKDDRRFFTSFDDAIGTAGAVLVGQSAQLTFVEKKAGEKTYFNVSAIAPAPESTAAAASPAVAPAGDREPGAEG